MLAAYVSPRRINRFDVVFLEDSQGLFGLRGWYQADAGGTVDEERLGFGWHFEIEILMNVLLCAWNTVNNWESKDCEGLCGLKFSPLISSTRHQPQLRFGQATGAMGCIDDNTLTNCFIRRRSFVRLLMRFRGLILVRSPKQAVLATIAVS